VRCLGVFLKPNISFIRACRSARVSVCCVREPKRNALCVPVLRGKSASRSWSAINPREITEQPPKAPRCKKLVFFNVFQLS